MLPLHHCSSVHCCPLGFVMFIFKFGLEERKWRWIDKVIERRSAWWFHTPQSKRQEPTPSSLLSRQKCTLEMPDRTRPGGLCSAVTFHTLTFHLLFHSWSCKNIHIPSSPSHNSPAAGPGSNPALVCITLAQPKFFSTAPGYPSWLMNPRHGTNTVKRE